MIPQAKLSEYTVPCKHKDTGRILKFTVIAYDYSDAIKQLEERLHPLVWVVGYGSM